MHFLSIEVRYFKTNGLRSEFIEISWRGEEFPGFVETAVQHLLAVELVDHISRGVRNFAQVVSLLCESLLSGHLTVFRARHEPMAEFFYFSSIWVAFLGKGEVGVVEDDLPFVDFQGGFDVDGCW